jgi:hypothetical protein
MASIAELARIIPYASMVITNNAGEVVMIRRRDTMG